MKTKMVGARVSLETVEEINQVVEEGYYLTPSHMIKEAILKELSRLDARARGGTGDMNEEILSLVQKLEDDIWDTMKSRSTFDQSLHAIYTRLGGIREKIQKLEEKANGS